MRPDDLRPYLERQPFQPFRLHLSSGAFFDIRHPQMVHIARSTLTVGFPLEGNLQRFAVVALVHVVWLEILLSAP
jgi:hypothetical protein